MRFARLAAAVTLAMHFGMVQVATAQRTTPVKLVIPTYGQLDLVIDAWNHGLGKPFDFVCDAPLADNFEQLARVKVGTHCWTSPSFAHVQQTADRAPKTIACLNYDFEHWSHTPQAEQDDVVGTSRAIRAFCDQRHWRAAIGPMYRDALRLAKPLAPYYDIYLVQCQKYQKDERRAETVRYLREVADAVHGVNPKCLVGCQLGTLDQYGDGTAGSGVKAATALYEQTKDFIQIYGVWWPPDGETLIKLLKAMDASPAKPAAAKPSPSPSRVIER